VRHADPEADLHEVMRSIDAPKDAAFCFCHGWQRTAGAESGSYASPILRPAGS
jgi:hypothetical protein